MELIKLNERKKMMLSILSIILIFVALGGIIFQPKIKEALRCSNELKAIGEDISKLEGLIDTLSKKETGEQKEKLISLQSRFLKEEQIPELLQQITNLASKNSLDLLAITPKVITVTENYKKEPYEIQMEGEYPQLVKFFGNLENLTKLIHIEEIQINNLENRYPRLKIRLITTIYILRW